MITDIEYADNYFSTLSFDTADWEALDDEAKQKALNVSEELMLRLPLISPLPENDNIKRACCEIALALAKGADLEESANSVGVLSDTYGSIKTVYRSEISEWLALGIPSYKAYQYLSPYILKNTKVVLVREN